jgi:hypothetical protein
MGVAGATVESGPILIAGVASLVAGSISMAGGEYASVSAQRDSEIAALAKERRELQENPKGELQELADYYRSLPTKPPVKQFLDDLGLSSLEQLPPLQQVGADVLPEDAAAAVQAMEQNLQASLDQAAIDFSEPSMDETSQSVTLARGDQQDNDQDVSQEEAQEQAQEGSEVSLPDEHDDNAPTESTPDTHDDRTRPE